MLFCGIDLHSNNCLVVVSDDNNKVVYSKRLIVEGDQTTSRSLNIAWQWRPAIPVCRYRSWPRIMASTPTCCSNGVAICAQVSSLARLRMK